MEDESESWPHPTATPADPAKLFETSEYDGSVASWILSVK